VSNAIRYIKVLDLEGRPSLMQEHKILLFDSPSKEERQKTPAMGAKMVLPGGLAIPLKDRIEHIEEALAHPKAWETNVLDIQAVRKLSRVTLPT